MPTNVKRWLLIAGAIALILAVAVACLNRDSGHVYDEAAHRRAVEAAFGDITDAFWPIYRDFWIGACGSDKDLASIGLAMQELGPGLPNAAELALNTTYLCPDRLDELPPEWRLD